MSQLSCYDHYLYVHQIIIIFNSILNFIVGNDLLPVLEYVIGVIKWDSLGNVLGIPAFELHCIQFDCYNNIHTMDRLAYRKVILKWLCTGLASWSSLVEALKCLSEMVIAEQISKDHPNNPSKYDTYVIINSDS